MSVRILIIMAMIRTPEGGSGAVRLSFLGKPTISLDGRKVAINRRKALVLLAYLARMNRPVARSRLADLFWPDLDASHGRANLRLILNTLRSVLPAALILSKDECLELNRDVVAECDLDLCLRPVPPAAGGPIQAMLDTLRPIVGKPFLEGVNLDSSPELDDWRFDTDQELIAGLCRTLEELRNRARAEQDAGAAADAAGLLLIMDPAREDLYEQLIESALCGGDVPEARRRFERLRRMLAREDGAEPSRRITAMVREAVPGTDRPDTAPKRPGRLRLYAIPGALALAAGLSVLSAFRKPEPSLAVLPFRYLCNEPGVESFAENFTMEIITSLAIQSDTPVAPYASIRKYGETALTVQQIAGELGATHILDGSAMRNGETIRYSMQLIDIREDRCLWAGLYEYDFTPSSQTMVIEEVTDRVLEEL